MNPTLALAAEETLTPPAALSFAIRHSREMPTYYELALEDEQGSLAHWVIPQPLKQLAKRPVLLWMLTASPVLDSLACVESGAMQLAAARLGTVATLRQELAQGVLRLNFNGQLLRGYYRLQRLPIGGGQLWQLIPVGNV